MSRHQNVIGLTLLAYILAFLNTDVGFALQLQLEGQASQSSTSGGNLPGLAVDNNIATTSITEKQANPWWKVNLNDIYCLKKITLFTRPTDDGDQIEEAEVRAGLSSDHLQNRMIGSPLTLAQAQSGAQIEFTLDPTVITRYVSVDIPTSSGERKSIILSEIEFEEITQSEDNTLSSALPLSGNPSFQSSTRTGQDASRALDGDPLVFTHTNPEQNPWWKVDLVTEYCVGKIRILNRPSQQARLIGAVVRAGLSDVHTENAVCGSPVTQQQAVSGHWIEFRCDPPILSRYVSVDIPDSMKILSLSGVQVITCKEIDFTLVTNISLIGQTGDNEAAITAYIGCSDLTANVSFGRQLTTGGTNTGLPTGFIEVDDPVLDRAARSLILPEAGGIDRVGVFYSKVSKSGRITKMQTILLPKNDGDVNILPEQQTLSVNVGESVTLTMVQNSQTNANVRWKHNEDALNGWNNQLTLSIQRVVKKSDEGIYSCFVDGQEHQQRHGIMRLIVRACPTGMWGMMCLNECRRCYNGGICDDHTGTCVCAPGFSGDNCEKVHGRHVFGKDAQYGCSDNHDPHHNACQGNLFCLPDPYGCSCAAGYMGLNCMQECPNGMYGADCKQTCHCQGEGTCLKDTGECMEGVGCQPTYFGPNCQCTGVIVDITVNLHIARSDGPSEITLQWDAMTCADYYRVEYSQINKDMCQTVDSSSATVNTHCSCQSTSTTIPDLDSNSVYLVRVEARFGLINGTAATSEIMTRTSEPTAAPTDVLNSAETNTSLSFSWSEPLCGGRGGNITGYTYKLTQVGSVEQYDISSTMVTTHGLIPYTDYSFQVAASTSEGTGPFSNSVNARTAEGVPPAPMDLMVKNADGSSITVGWTEPDPPHGIIINYDISYWPSTQDEESANITTNVSVTSITYRVEGLMTNVTYFIKVRAKTSAGAGVWSDAVNGITQVGATTKAPSPPTGSGTIVGVLIAVIIIAIIIIVVIIFLKRRSRKSNGGTQGLQLADTPLQANNVAVASPVCVEPAVPTPSGTPSPSRQPTVQLPELKQVPFTNPPPIRIDELEKYIQMKKSAAADKGFDADYKTLPDGQLHPWTVARKPENKSKNRYANVIAYDHCRVVLEPLENDPHSDYINACFIDGYKTKDKYIASQGPNKESIKDIWRMIWQQKVDKIVMLTNPIEDGKMKCLQYWADKGASEYTGILVTTVKEDVFLDYTVRIFNINEVGKDEQFRVVKHFHYTTWPDMKPPEYPTPLLNFLRVVNAHQNTGRTVIHCSAGVGRTGTYITLDTMLEQMKQEGQVEVLGFINQMRHRRIKSVQTVEQYKFLYDAILEAYLSVDTTYHVTEYRRKLTALKKMGMSQQFEVLTGIDLVHIRVSFIHISLFCS